MTNQNDGGDFGRYPCEDEDMWNAEENRPCCENMSEANHSRENGICYFCAGCVGGCGNCITETYCNGCGCTCCAGLNCSDCNGCGCCASDSDISEDNPQPRTEIIDGQEICWDCSCPVKEHSETCAWA